MDSAPSLSSSTSRKLSRFRSASPPRGSKLETYLRGKSMGPSDFSKMSLSGIPEFIPASSRNGFEICAPSPPESMYSETPSSSSSCSTSSKNANSSSETRMSSLPNDDSNLSYYSDGGTTYFISQDSVLVSNSEGTICAPNYSVYTGTPNQVANLKMVRGSVPSMMADSDLKMDLLKRQLICLSVSDPDSRVNVPSSVDNFREICSLESHGGHPPGKSRSFGYVSSTYKAVNGKNGSHVCLRRIHNFRLVNTKCMVLVEQWKKITHANVATLRQVFTTKDFGDQSIVFVYDLYPGSETLTEKQFSIENPLMMNSYCGDGSRGNYSGIKGSSRSPSSPIPESLIWTYVIQLTSALRTIHSNGLAYRTLDPSKILILSKNRLILNCGGILDVLTFDPNASTSHSNMAHYQQEDLLSLGKVVLALACNSFLAIQRENLQSSMEIITSTYSSDLRNLIMYLLTNPNRIKSINDLMPMIGARFYAILDEAYIRNDVIEAECAKDMESSRLFRLLTKLSTIVDRAELNNDYEWSEYGDRYMLKLFRDYVFHQVMENNRPWLDMSHVISCLNKLDTGVPDKVCLMSRDEQNVLVVSYAEMRRCLEQSFNECILSANKSDDNYLL